MAEAGRLKRSQIMGNLQNGWKNQWNCKQV